MQAKPVELRNGRKFSKTGDANDFFKEILNGGALKVYLTGDEAAAVDALFRDYCAATDWAMPAEPENYFRDWNMAENRATRGFFVEFISGETDDFSYIKAVRAVANWRRPT